MVKPPLPTSEMTDARDEFTAIYESHAPLIYRFMFWRTKDDMLAQDLTSNVFEKAWRSRTSFTGGSSRAWLYRIARNTLIDYWRKKRDVPLDETAVAQLGSEAPAVEEVLDRQFAAEALYIALDKLPPDMRAVIDRRFVEGLSAAETARQLGISEGNVRIIQYRALRKLRGYLQ